MAINRSQNPNPYSLLFTQALAGLPLPLQTGQKPPQGAPPQTTQPLVNPFQSATLGSGNPLDQFGLFQNLLASGQLQPNLEQPPIPPEGLGRRFLATA